MATLTPLYDRSSRGTMNVVALMSGTGSNLVKILEHERRLRVDYGSSPFQVVVVFTDTWDPEICKAAEIGAKFNRPVLTRDINGFYADRGKKKKNLKKMKERLDADPTNDKLSAEYAEQLGIRREFDRVLVRSLYPYDASIAVGAGYMSILTEPFTDSFLGVNVHPADLSIKDEQGRRKYVGDHAVRDAICAGEKRICSSTHRIEQVVDCGRLFMVSRPMDVVLPDGFDPANGEMLDRVAKENQGNLKKVGDWDILPRTLEYLARGRFESDETGLFYFDKKPIPDGYRLEK